MTIGLFYIQYKIKVQYAWHFITLIDLYLIICRWVWEVLPTIVFENIVEIDEKMFGRGIKVSTERFNTPTEIFVLASDKDSVLFVTINELLILYVYPIITAPQGESPRPANLGFRDL